MHEIDFYLVDAFSQQAFGGNAAAVCILDDWLPDETMQKMAQQHNQSETAFIVKQQSGFALRWFTSRIEVNLCGHATLAAAHVIFNHLHYPDERLHFDTLSGRLTVSRSGNKHASGLVSSAIGLLLACLLLLMPASQDASHLAVLSVFWGIAIMVIGLGMQVKVLALAPDATDVAMSLFSGIFNIGIGAGALLGSQISTHFSMSVIGYVGAVPALAAFIWSVVIFRRWPATSLEEQAHQH